MLMSRTRSSHTRGGGQGCKPRIQKKGRWRVYDDSATQTESSGNRPYTARRDGSALGTSVTDSLSMLAALSIAASFLRPRYMRDFTVFSDTPARTAASRTDFS